MTRSGYAHGIANGETTGGHILSHYSSRADNRSIADCYSFQNDGAGANEDSPANFYRLGGLMAKCWVICPTPIARGNVKVIIDRHSARTKNGAFANLDRGPCAKNGATQAHTAS